jgi:Flp pilus assembly protein TadB
VTVVVLVGGLLAAAALLWPPGGAERASRLRALAIDPGPVAGTSTPHVPVLSPMMLMELVAAALDAGLPPPNAVEAAARAAGPLTWSQLEDVVRLWQLGESTQAAWGEAGPTWQPLARCLLLSEGTGASAATILRSAARDLRSNDRRTARVGAQRLGVRLVVPLGLTTLPAFLLWAVVPVVLGLAGQLLDGA